jgi:hypothetical protein
LKVLGEGGGIVIDQFQRVRGWECEDDIKIIKNCQTGCSDAMKYINEQTEREA